MRTRRTDPVTPRLSSTAAGFAAIAVLSALCALCALCAFCGPATAQGTGTGIVVDTEPGMQLRCARTVSFDVTPQRLTQLVTGTASASGEVTLTSPATSVDVATTVSGWEVTIVGLDTSPDALSFTDEALDICEVRAITLEFGTYAVAVELNGTVELPGPDGSIVSITGVRARPGFSTGAYTSSFGVSWFLVWLLGNRFTIDIELDFDLASATRPGQHTSDRSGAFIVTATSP